MCSRGEPTLRIAGIEPDGGFELLDRLASIGFVAAIPIELALQERRVGLDIAGRQVLGYDRMERDRKSRKPLQLPKF